MVGLSLRIYHAVGWLAISWEFRNIGFDKNIICQWEHHNFAKTLITITYLLLLPSNNREETVLRFGRKHRPDQRLEAPSLPLPQLRITKRLFILKLFTTILVLKNREERDLRFGRRYRPDKYLENTLHLTAACSLSQLRIFKVWIYKFEIFI